MAGRRSGVADTDRGSGPADRTPLRLAQAHAHGSAAAAAPAAGGLARHRAGAALQAPRYSAGRAGVLGHRCVLHWGPADAVKPVAGTVTTGLGCVTSGGGAG